MHDSVKIKRLITAPCLFVLLWLSGCASDSKSLASSDWKVANGRDVIVVVPHGEPDIRVDETNTSALPQTGLLGAAVAAAIDQTIDAVRTSRGESFIGPVRDALVDYDFGGAAVDAVNRAVANAPWLDVKNVVLAKEDTSRALSTLMDESKASQIVYLCVGYGFSSDLNALKVDLSARILKKMPAPASVDTTCDRPAPYKALYAHKWSYREKLYLARDGKSNAELWADDKGVRVRSAVESGTAKLARELTIDLYQGPAEPDDKSSATASEASSNAATWSQPRRGPVFP